jgi:hypothetical protein
MSRAMVVRSMVLKAAMPGAIPGSVLGILVLAACSAGPLNPGGGSSAGTATPGGMASGGRPSLETQEACRRRTSEIYERRSRPEIYAANSSVNAPFSANFQPDVPSRGLSGQFAFERALAECERGASTVSDRAEPQTIGPPAQPIRPAARTR